MFPVQVRCVTFDAGYPAAQEVARKALEVGKVYTIMAMYVGQSSTVFEFWEVRGTFGSEFFEPVWDFGHDGMQGRITHTGEDGTLTDVTEAVQALYDLAIGSMDFRSGFWSAEDAEPVGKLAVICNFDQSYDILKYIAEEREKAERGAFYRQNFHEIHPRHDQVDAWDRMYEALQGHECVYSSLGKCMWPGCDKWEAGQENSSSPAEAE